MKKELRS